MSMGQVSRFKQSAHQDDRATRQLCTGVYFDREFRDTVIERVLLDRSHRVSPSYGFDLIPVVHHAKHALLLDLCVTGVFGLVFLAVGLLSPAVAFTTACLLSVWGIARQAALTAPDLVRHVAKQQADRWFKRIRYERETAALDEMKRALRLRANACALFAFLGFTTAVMSGRDPGNVLWSSTLVVLLLACVAAGAGALLRHHANLMYRSKRLRPPRLTPRMAVIDEQQNSTVVVHRRPDPKVNDDLKILRQEEPEDDEPTYFVGSGKIVHRWLPPINVPLLKPGEDPMLKREYIPSPFQADELVEVLRSAMMEFEGGIDPQAPPGFKVVDRVYVEESKLSSDRSVLLGPLGEQNLREIINTPYGRFQHFLEMQISESGELVECIFLRVTIKARVLCLDFATSALTRLPRDYELLGTYGEDGLGSILRDALASAWDLPGTLGRARVLTKIPELMGILLWARRDRTKKPRRGSHIGTVFSLREEKAESWTDSVMDHPSILEHIKIIESRLLKIIEDFLEDKQVDVSEFRKRAQTVISATVLNMGGRMEISGSAVGTNSQVQHVDTIERAEGS